MAPWTRVTCAIWVLALMCTCRIAAEHTSTCKRVRFTTYNASLNRNKAGQLLRELQSGASAQAASVSAILQSIRPDIVVLNEFDYEPGNAAVKAFQDNFLGVAQAPGLQPLSYPYAYTAPVNTGIPSGRDFDHDGRTDGPADAFGYGFHPGQYGMVLLSKSPIDAEAARTFQHFLVKDMPGALLPTDPTTGQPWYSKEDLEVLRLSSKSHWDLPVDIPLGPGLSKRLHMLLHHPTPPAFDGREGRNLRRNFDEIRLVSDLVGCSRCPSAHQQHIQGVSLRASQPVLHSTAAGGSSCAAGAGPLSALCAAAARAWQVLLDAWAKLYALYSNGEAMVRQSHQEHRLTKAPQQQQLEGAAQPGLHDAYIYDDAGKRGGLAAGASFVIAGDHNADPLDGDSYDYAINQLLNCCNITASFTPTSEGGKEAGSRHPTDRTPPETKTSTFDLRVDYILPSRDLTVLGGAVFWPRRAQKPQSEWVLASDHRAVWLDVEVCHSNRLAVAV